MTLRPADICGESFYNPLLQPLADELKKSGAAHVNDGALCLFPKGFTNKEGEPLPLIVQKSDGGFGYATTDLAAIRYRVRDLKATRILYVVGAPQTQHLAMIIEAAKELSWLTADTRAEHVPFGSVLGTDKRMFKTRSGDTVRLVDLIDEAIDRATVVVREKSNELSEEEQAEVGRKVGVGALKYADLSSDRVKDYVFDVDRMVSFEGNTAGYLQYAYARIRSLFRKASVSFEEHQAPLLLTEKEERALVISLLGFGRAITAVEASLEPHRLAGLSLFARDDVHGVLREMLDHEVGGKDAGLAALRSRSSRRSRSRRVFHSSASRCPSGCNAAIRVPNPEPLNGCHHPETRCDLRDRLVAREREPSAAIARS